MQKNTNPPNETLEDIAQEISSCEKCTLAANRTNTVPGYGNPNADIMFIGEGPGKNEDEQGLPFVGAAGKFLDELLATIHLKREDVFIANVVKCRPPGNRDPLPDEVQACWPYLARQLAIIKPKIIVNLGRHSMDRFIPNRRISQDHGKLMRRTIESLGTYIFYPIYHPAAALYNGSLRDVLIQDFAKIPKILEKIKQEESQPTKEETEKKQTRLL